MKKAKSLISLLLLVLMFVSAVPAGAISDGGWTEKPTHTWFC